jgi:predicted TPR repeat methyltransferase
MGYSLNAGKLEILDWFVKNEHKINRILDIGAGSGTYINLIKFKNNICFKSEWVGVEVWEDYINKFDLNKKYDLVINEDIRKIDWNKIGKFSVVIAGDVLEHMNKNDAILLVNNILNHCDTLIISIPIIHMPQDAINGNPFEIHVKDDWSHEEIMSTWKNNIKNSYRKSKKSKIGVYWLKN